VRRRQPVLVVTLFQLAAVVGCSTAGGAARSGGDIHQPAGVVPTIAVMPFAGGADGADTALALSIGETVASRLAANRGLRMVEASQFEPLLQERRMQATGLFDEESRLVEGCLLGADVLVAGSLARIGQSLQVSVRVVEVQTGHLLRGFVARGSETDVFALADGLADDLSAPLLALRVADSGPRTEARCRARAEAR
jgi:TolB-like protein